MCEILRRFAPQDDNGGFVDKKLPNIQENIPLSEHTTFRIGGAARYFCAVKNKEEIIAAIEWAKENPPAGGFSFFSSATESSEPKFLRNKVFSSATESSEPKFLRNKVFILGGGSNILVSDKGFNGLVIKIKNEKLKIKNYNEKFKIIEAESGVLLGKLVMEAINHNLTGLEWAIGIPGTIAGAVVGNAGAYGHSISESVEEVKTLSINFNSSSRATRQTAGRVAISTQNNEIASGFALAMTEKKYNNKGCQFGYRKSIFKTGDIILEVILRLQKGDKEKSRALLRDIVSNRQGKIPPYPSAGSVFKNYELKKGSYEDDPLIKRFPELLEKIQGGKIAVGYLIEQCGLKGKKIGGAMIAQEHANFIVNLGGAKAKDVVVLIKLCKEKVKEKFGIELKEEIRYVGFD